MRILVNALFLIPNGVGGSETYLRCLLNALGDVDQENDYVLCLSPEAAPTFRAPGPHWRIVVSPLGSKRRPGRLALEQTWIPRVAAAVRADVVHSPGYTGPLVSSARRVTTIHDMNYKAHPEDLSLAERVVYAALIPRVALRSHRVIAITEAARRDILRWTRVRPENVSVVYEAARTSWPGDPREDSARLAAAGIAEPFVLSVAAAYPHKNLGRLVQAFPLATPHRLIIVGLKGRATPEIHAAVEQRPDLIRVLGWVDDALLGSLYRRATALAFPSLYEGFGLPILEAMALGTAVLTSNFGAMAEVAGGAAEVVDPYDVTSIRAGLERIITGDDAYREQLGRRGLQRSAEFSWTRTARDTLRVYEQALGS